MGAAPTAATTRTTTTTTTTTPTTTTLTTTAPEEWLFYFFTLQRPVATMAIGAISVAHSVCHFPHLLMYRRLGLLTAFWSLVGIGLVIGSLSHEELYYDLYIWGSMVYVPVMLAVMLVVLTAAVWQISFRPLRALLALVAVVFYLLMFYCIVYVMNEKRALFSTTTTTTTTTTCPTCLTCTTPWCTTPEDCSTPVPPFPGVVVVYRTYLLQKHLNREKTKTTKRLLLRFLGDRF